MVSVACQFSDALDVDPGQKIRHQAANGNECQRARRLGGLISSIRVRSRYLHPSLLALDNVADLLGPDFPRSSSL